jgi:hypothetical protein
MKQDPDTKTMELPVGPLAQLRAPFAPNQISLLPKPYNKDAEKGWCKECNSSHGLPAMHLEYVGHAALTDRLLDVDPLWSWEPLSFDAHGLPTLDADGGMWIRLTVCGVTRLGYGDAQGKKGPNATKERIGDALRNAAMRFGCALDLWHKGILHMDSDEPDDAPPAQQAQPQARAERELCGQEKFATNSKAWQAVVASGKKTPDELIAFLGTKLDFTEQQTTTIRSWKKN